MLVRRPRIFTSALSLALFIALLVLGRPQGLVAQSLLLDGTVVDPDGRPVPDARVLISQANALVATIVTDHGGSFQLDDRSGLDSGPYRLLVSLDGFQATPIDVHLDPSDPQSVTLALRVSAYRESVVVSASSVERPRSETPDTVTVITADDLRAEQIETVADALRFVPGLTVTATGGPGALTSLFPRGGESDFSLILIDGIRVNDFGGAYDVAHLPVTDIERIEVVRGPQSALWGSDAIGGVVQIITKRGGPSRSDGVFEGGSFGTYRAGASTAGSLNAWSWGAGFELFDTDGFTGEAPATGEAVTNDDYLRRDFSGSLGWRGHRTDVVGHVRGGRNERGVPGPYGSDPAGNFAGVDDVSRGRNRTIIASLDVTQRWSDRVRQQMTISTLDVNSEFDSPFGESTADTKRTTFRTQADAVLNERTDISAGLELQRERAGSTFITDDTASPTPVTRFVAGYFGEARFDVASRLLVTTGLRVEQIRRNALVGFASPFSTRPAFSDRTEIAVNPKVSAAYMLRPAQPDDGRWTRLRASAGTGIRPPSAFEIAFTDNPDLNSERSRSLDFGIEQALAGETLVLESTVFFNEYDDLIVAISPSFADLSRFRTDNIANSRARGLELGGVWRRGPLETRVSYTFMDTDVLAVDTSASAPPPFEVGDPLLRRPRHQGSISLRAAFDRGTAYVRAGSRSATLDVEPNFGAFGGLFESPGYAVVDLGASVTLAPGLEVIGRIDNLLDRHYEEGLGFPALGRRVLGGLRVATR